MQNFVKYFK